MYNSCCEWILQQHCLMTGRVRRLHRVDRKSVRPGSVKSIPCRVLKLSILPVYDKTRHYSENEKIN